VSTILIPKVRTYTSRVFAITDAFLENYILANAEWKYDIIPEIMDGKNIADFVDPDILEKLDALEQEEERLQAEGFYDSDEGIVSCVVHVIVALALTPIFGHIRKIQTRRNSSRRRRKLRKQNNCPKERRCSKTGP